jgi:hydroxypyruvate isomerase
MDRRKFVSHSLVAGIAGMGLSACATQSNSSSDNAQSGIMPLDERKRWLAPFSCNIEQWFRPMPFLDRFAAAKALGFRAVEIWEPVAKRKAPSAQIIADTAKAQNMRVTTISPKAPEIGDSQYHGQFLDYIDHVIDLMNMFDLSSFNLTGHKLIEGLSTEQMVENYTQALILAEPKLRAANKVATIEPYNPFNHPGHFVYGVEPALSIARAVNSPHVKLNWDFFHMQRTNGNLITHLENGFDQVGYVQFADSPDRNQPGTGEVNYANVFTKVRELGYKGYIGAEFFPKDKNPLKAASDLAKVAKSINLS